MVRRVSGAGFACVMLFCRAVPSCGVNVGANINRPPALHRPHISTKQRPQAALHPLYRQHFHRHPWQYPVMLCNTLPLASVTPSALLRFWPFPCESGRNCKFQPMDKGAFGYFCRLTKVTHRRAFPAWQGENRPQAKPDNFNQTFALSAKRNNKNQPHYIGGNKK